MTDTSESGNNTGHAVEATKSSGTSPPFDTGTTSQAVPRAATKEELDKLLSRTLAHVSNWMAERAMSLPAVVPGEHEMSDGDFIEALCCVAPDITAVADALWLLYCDWDGPQCLNVRLYPENRAELIRAASDAVLEDGIGEGRVNPWQLRDRVAGLYRAMANRADNAANSGAVTAEVQR